MIAHMNSPDRKIRAAIASLVFLTLWVFAVGSAHAFDCKVVAVLNAAEKIICESDALMARDKDLNTLFRRLAQKPMVMPEMMRKRQRSWLNERDECADIACLERLYEQRIRHLQLIEGRIHMGVPWNLTS